MNAIIFGIGEALKLSLIGGKNTYNLFLQKYNEKDYISIIKIASLVKRLIIEHDEFEKHIRKVLNYGHTIGHTIESTTHYYIPHGIAVLIGMYIKNKLFYDNKYEDINNLILNMVNKQFFDTPFNFSSFIEHILSDKKNRGNDICFILLEDIGNTKITYKKTDDFFISLQKIIADLFKKNNTNNINIWKI
jgi:3-dehydroquinate synthase